MIKLTLNPDKESKVFTLDQEHIVIGNSQAPTVDIPLSHESIKEIHVKIIEENDRFIVCNSANDPFTSLNGLPFGKKTLKNFDLIEVGPYSIKFEFVEEREGDEKEHILEETHYTELDADPDLDIEFLLKEVENFAAPSEPEKASEKTNEASPLLVQENEPADEENEEESSSSKKYYLHDFDDESEQWFDENPEQQIPESDHKGRFADSWKMLAGLLFAIIALSTVICSGVYFRASGKNSQEEKKIAAGIADIAMAITHAKLNHITPNKQNWADPNFIRNNLSRVLSPNLHTQAQIDGEGQFIRYPYRLRVYTSRDMDRFIVIAQPAPNLMQWLVHKKTIVLDSAKMDMRKITDLKAINRLLANPNPLEGTNGEELNRLIGEGSLMSLNSLAGHKNHWGFSPPKALGYMRPGAENYIYNAPRYYPFGEEFLRKAINLYGNPGSPSDVAIIQDEMEELSNFPNIILYTSEGLQAAIEAQKALETFAPNSKFLVAYVKFNPKGFVASSHLLMNDERDEIAFLHSPRTQLSSFLGREMHNWEESNLLSINNEEDSLLALESKTEENINDNHPLFLRLKSLFSDRQKALKSLSWQMIELLNHQNSGLEPDFQSSFNLLFASYVKTDEQHRNTMIKELGKLYQEYIDMPLEEFISFVDKAGLTPFAHASLDAQKNSLGDEVLSDQMIESHYDAILKSESLSELENRVEMASRLLTLENLPDPEKLIHYQEQMHNHALGQLSHFILSQESIYQTEPLDENDRESVIHILQNSWISDPHEYDYFISEFDHLLHIKDPNESNE